MATSATTARQLYQRTLQWDRDILLIFGVALAVRMLFATLIDRTYDYDEFVLLLLSRDYAHGAIPYRDFMFFHPPGALMILRMLEPLTALWWQFARVFMLLIDSMTAVLVWRIGMNLQTRREAMLAGLLYAFCPLTLISAVRIGQDSLLTALAIAGLTMLLLYQSHRAAALAGTCLALAVWIKYPAAALLPVYALAAGRRIPSVLAGILVVSAAFLLSVLPEWHAFFTDTVTFQRTRWLMPIGQRVETMGLFWVLAIPLAIPGLLRVRRPLWLPLGFLSGAVFMFGSQVYYHYFVPLVPFGALLASPVANRLGLSRRFVVVTGSALALGWVGLINLGGTSPLFVTAAHFSDVQPTIQFVQKRTGSEAFILADRYEYAYLARRKALVHYFWNVGTVVNARYLEHHLRPARAVILSDGASSGFPAGFTNFLNQRYRSYRVGPTTVWLHH